MAYIWSCGGKYTILYTLHTKVTSTTILNFNLTYSQLINTHCISPYWFLKSHITQWKKNKNKCHSIGCIPVRLLMAIMMFTACWTSYTCRLQMPILAVPMIAVSSTVDSLNNKTQGVCDRRAKRSLITTYDLETDLLLENLGYNDQIIAEYQDKNSRRVRELMRESNNDPSSRQNSLNDDFHSQHLRQGFQLFSNKPFDWDSDVRGRLISFYAIGNVPGNFIGGWLAMR